MSFGSRTVYVNESRIFRFPNPAIQDFEIGAMFIHEARHIADNNCDETCANEFAPDYVAACGMNLNLRGEWYGR